MKKFALFNFLLLLVLFACDSADHNPFFSDYDTSFQTPPFEKIKESHFMPAFQEGMKEQQAEIRMITENREEPTFENTIEALERSGSLLTKVSSVFYNLTSAQTNDEIQKISKEIAPQLSKHNDDISLNEKLFQRVKIIYQMRDRLNLSPEEKKLLDETYKYFVRGGANLSETDKNILREINKELSLLSIQFGENVLKETNNFELVIEKEEDLAGLTDAAVAAAAAAAEERSYPGKWVFTLHKPSLIPFLQYSEKRDLREKIFKAYINLGNNNNEYDNKKILTRMASLRVQKANLLGYDTHAHFILEENMAGEPGQVYDLLKQLWEPALAKAKHEADQLQEMIYREDHNFKLQPWDWWYYAEKLKKEKYDLD
ncbi:MAG: peptidase M3, partial [Calditrichaeota bacterium]|nr:peptidase M3 [Calditrichota bacterium]